ncbi:hypothetical protein BDW66DRAFT_112800 [Aspergillus desertorum]
MPGCQTPPGQPPQISVMSISVTGSLYLVAEIVEQIAWLIAGLQTSSSVKVLRLAAHR